MKRIKIIIIIYGTCEREVDIHFSQLVSKL